MADEGGSSSRFHASSYKSSWKISLSHLRAESIIPLDVTSFRRIDKKKKKKKKGTSEMGSQAKRHPQLHTFIVKCADYTCMWTCFLNEFSMQPLHISHSPDSSAESESPSSSCKRRTSASVWNVVQSERQMVTQVTIRVDSRPFLTWTEKKKKLS